jgi:hypothetical protein
MKTTGFISKRTNLLILLFALSGIPFLLIMFVLLNPQANLSPGPYEVQVIKARCPEEMNRQYRILWKDFSFPSQTRIWYPSEPNLKDLTTIIMFPATRIQCRGFRWMAKHLASRGYVVTICKNKIDAGWVTLIPGIRWIERSGGPVQDKDLCAMQQLIDGLTGQHGQSAGRLAHQRTGVISRIGMSGTINNDNASVGELKNGVLLAIVEESEDGIFVISSEEFVPFDPGHKTRDRKTGLRSYFFKGMNLAMNQMATIDFFPARMIINLSGTVREVNRKHYMSIQEELFTYFSDKSDPYR